MLKSIREWTAPVLLGRGGLAGHPQLFSHAFHPVAGGTRLLALMTSARFTETRVALLTYARQRAV